MKMKNLKRLPVSILRIIPMALEGSGQLLQQQLHPPALLAKISAPITEKTSAFINDVRGFYLVPEGDQAPAVVSDGYRAGLKRKVAGISRSLNDIYPYADT